MDARTTSLEEFLSAVLRGAAKILGCGSTSLILINEKTQEISIRLGTLAVSYAMVAEVEQMVGSSLRGISFPISEAQDSLVYRAWRERSILETSSLAELVGNAFGPSITDQLSQLIGEHRFICVPALSTSRCYGVLMFQKEGRHPFNRQQRELILRYAHRIGEILENDLTEQGQRRMLGAAIVQHGGEEVDLALETQLLQLSLGEPLPALFVDPELRIASGNQACEQVFGVDTVELVHRPIGELFADPSAIEDILRQQILDPGNPYCEESAVVLRADGRLCPARVEALFLAGETDQAVGFLVLVREAADKRESSAKQLVEKERLATMGELAAQLAHEIRNPLVAIGATLEALGRDPMLSSDHRQVLSSVVNEIVRLDMTLKDYLAAPRETSFTEVELSGVVTEACRLLQSACGRTGKSISLCIPPGLRLLADYDGMKHLFFNLLLNAIEASPPEGEVRCHATASPRHLTVAVEDRGGGLGASPEECFQPFFTTKKNGTGLGLSVCQKIARAHGGLVELRGREGGGCRATVTLPRARYSEREVAG